MRRLNDSIQDAAISAQIDLFCKLSVMVLSMPVLLAILDTISEFLV